jgi:hypothetical protein
MSRAIFVEGFTWVLKTRLRGSPVVRPRPSPRARATAADPSSLTTPSGSETTSEAASGR